MYLTKICLLIFVWKLLLTDNLTAFFKQLYLIKSFDTTTTNDLSFVENYLIFFYFLLQETKYTSITVHVILKGGHASMFVGIAVHIILKGGQRCAMNKFNISDETLFLRIGWNIEKQDCHEFG